jgi:hypothetical protein
MKNLAFWMELNTPKKWYFAFYHSKVVGILHFVFHEKLLNTAKIQPIDWAEV